MGGGIRGGHIPIGPSLFLMIGSRVWRLPLNMLSVSLVLDALGLVAVCEFDEGKPLPMFHADLVYLILCRVPNPRRSEKTLPSSSNQRRYPPSARRTKTGPRCHR